MDAQVQATLQKMAAYIEQAQTALDKHNEMRDAFVKRAHQVAGVLANKGLLDRESVDRFVDKIAADETGTEVWALVEKLANALPTDDLGMAAKVASSGRKLDPFEKLALFGDARADAKQSGMFD